MELSQQRTIDEKVETRRVAFGLKPQMAETIDNSKYIKGSPEYSNG